MVQAGFERNEQPQEEMDEAKYKGKTVKLGKPIGTGTDEPESLVCKDPNRVKMVRFGHQVVVKIRLTRAYQKIKSSKTQSFRASNLCNPVQGTKHVIGVAGGRSQMSF